MKRLLFVLLLTLPVSAWGNDDAKLAFTQHPGAPLPVDAPLVDETGRPTTLRAAAAGLPLVIVPGYFHCPNLCSTVRADLLHALADTKLVQGRDYALAAITIDPAESPATAAATRHADLMQYPLPGGAADVHYLTGPAASLEAIAGAEGFHARYDKLLKQFMHPAGLVFATPGGRVSGYLLGVGYTPAALTAAIGRAQRRLSAFAQPILLLCFHFDPTTGRYTVAVIKLLRLAAALTVVTLGGTLLLMHRRGGRA